VGGHQQFLTDQLASQSCSDTGRQGGTWGLEGRGMGSYGGVAFRLAFDDYAWDMGGGSGGPQKEGRTGKGLGMGAQ
jgi:hypothetical protein